MSLSQIKTEKITNIYDYLALKEKIDNNEIETQSLDGVLNTLGCSVDKNDKTKFIVPFPIDGYDENFAILSPCIFSIFEGKAILEYTVSIMTLTQLNFSFHVSGEMYIILE